jgi:hypothetical protein
LHLIRTIRLTFNHPAASHNDRTAALMACRILMCCVYSFLNVLIIVTRQALLTVPTRSIYTPRHLHPLLSLFISGDELLWKAYRTTTSRF